MNNTSKEELTDVKQAAKDLEQKRVEQTTQQEEVDERAEYLGSLVYGGLGGIITMFAIVSGVFGAALAPGVILILGLSNLLANGFSSATGAYLALKSELEVFKRERHHASEQIVNHPDQEKTSLYEHYLQQGYSEDRAHQLVEIISEDPGHWVSAILAEKRLLLPKLRKPWMEGIAAFIAFIIAGSIPLLVYFAELIFKYNLPTTTAFLISTGLSALALFSLGAAKVIFTKRSALRSGMEMLIIGSLAALVAFGVGTLLKSFVA